jgi:hypothetical protein
MTTQLQLIEAPAGVWRLDDATRDIGRRGVAQARSALRAARLRSATGDDAHTDHDDPTHHIGHRAHHADAA